MPRLKLSANTRAARVKTAAKIKKVRDKYDGVENFSFDKQPFVETMKEAEIKEVSEILNRKSNRKSNKVLNYKDRLEEAYSDKSYTFVQDLEAEGVNSVKGVACKKKKKKTQKKPLNSLQGIFLQSY